MSLCLFCLFPRLPEPDSPACYPIYLLFLAASERRGRVTEGYLLEKIAWRSPDSERHPGCFSLLSTGARAGATLQPAGCSADRQFCWLAAGVPGWVQESGVQEGVYRVYRARGVYPWSWPVVTIRYPAG